MCSPSASVYEFACEWVGPKRGLHWTPKGKTCGLTGTSRRGKVRRNIWGTLIKGRKRKYDCEHGKRRKKTKGEKRRKIQKVSVVRVVRSGE